MTGWNRNMTNGTGTMTRARWIRSLLLVLALASLATACSSKKSVGSDALLKGTDSKTGNTRLGETTTTTAPTATTVTTVKPKTTAPPTTAAAAPSVVVSIDSDSAPGGQFQPRVAQLRSGSIVRFVNRDTVARSVVSDNNTFSSGPIPPGGHWDWVAAGAGEHNYSDGTRPYAVGTIQVA
jgi:plastocyanin